MSTCYWSCNRVRGDVWASSSPILVPRPFTCIGQAPPDIPTVVCCVLRARSLFCVWVVDGIAAFFFFLHISSSRVNTQDKNIKTGVVGSFPLLPVALSKADHIAQAAGQLWSSGKDRRSYQFRRGPFRSGEQSCSSNATFGIPLGWLTLTRARLLCSTRIETTPCRVSRCCPRRSVANARGQAFREFTLLIFCGTWRQQHIPISHVRLAIGVDTLTRRFTYIFAAVFQYYQCPIFFFSSCDYVRYQM